MAQIVLVHGINQQQKSADMLESEWVPCLAGGVRTSGFSDVADRIRRDAAKPASIETRCRQSGRRNLQEHSCGPIRLRYKMLVLARREQIKINPGSTDQTNPAS
jgi:hypothetical protein